MGTLFRSEEMALCQLFIQPEAAYSSVSMLGETGVVMFRDLNEEVSLFMRKFVSEVRRCDELERKLRYIEAEVCKDVVSVPELQIIPKAPNPREIIDLEAHLEKVENEIVELSQNAVNLKSNFVELMELKHVLLRTQGFLTEEEADNTRALIGEERGQLGFVAGVVQRERVHSFERMLWRISRGNVFLRQAELDEPIEDPATGNLVFKTVFVAFFQGENLKSRVKKVCAGFHASIYPCPNSPSERREMVENLTRRLEDLQLVLDQTHDHRYRVLTEVAKNLHSWGVMVRKMKAIYHTLNMFNMDVTKKCLIGECWVPVSDLNVVRQALADGGIAVGSTIPSFVNVIETLEEPPTFNRTNKFTSGFQTLIDAYGIANYREANPALYTIISFPFLFAIMFGDLGHGIILTCFGLYMVLDEKRYMNKRGSNEIWNIFFGGRYVILLMGLFSIYTGFIYNDIFSLSMNIFGSSWSNPYDAKTLASREHFELDPEVAFKGTPHVFGVDPAWQISENKILYLNSFKMKMSIIIAVIHMTFGVAVSVINHVHFKNYVSIFLEFLPQVLFLLLLFGYMVFLIIAKWFIFYTTNKPEEIQYSQGCAPSALVTFINMMLMGHTEVKEGCKEYMYPNQELIQRILFVIAVLCIPVMLFGKPLYIKLGKKHQSKPKTTSNGNLNQAMELQPVDPELGNGDTAAMAAAAAAAASAAAAAATSHSDEEHEDFSEVMVHQAIHTIEYVLSTVSHTASYLRLWALSLAHSQLSEVLWTMVMKFAFIIQHPVGGIAVFIVFAFWAFFTLAILVMMEGMSAFLHTLRLHWVEFMSKFYGGNGYLFQPFSFRDILFAKEEEE